MSRLEPLIRHYVRRESPLGLNVAAVPRGRPLAQSSIGAVSEARGPISRQDTAESFLNLIVPSSDNLSLVELDF